MVANDFINKVLNRLQQSNDRSKYLALLRVMLCGWFLMKIFFNWPVMEQFYMSKEFTMPVSRPLAMFHLNHVWLKNHYQWVVFTVIGLLLLNIIGIGRHFIAFLLFLAVTILFRMNDYVNNGGDRMALLVLFYMIFANSYSHFVLFKKCDFSPSVQKLSNLVNNLVAYSIMLNLCLVYLMAGLSKLVDPYWQQGNALYYFLYDKRYFIGDPRILSRIPLWCYWLINYATIVCEISFPILIWYKRTRNTVLILGLMMHTFIYSFLMIYGMSVIFVIQYGLFYTNEEVNTAWERIRFFFTRQPRSIAKRN